jgi:hypothetical protein
MSFSTTEKINAAYKLALQVLGTANESPGLKEYYNETLSWMPIIPDTKIWTELRDIPSANNFTEADVNCVNFPTLIEKKIIRITQDITSNGRFYIAKLTYNDMSSQTLDNWVMPSLIRNNNDESSIGYTCRLYHGNPLSGGIELPTSYRAGNDGSVCWNVNYSIGCVHVSSDESSHFLSLYNTNGLYVVAYRYIGKTLADGVGFDSSKILTASIQIAHNDPRYNTDEFALVLTDNAGNVLISK